MPLLTYPEELDNLVPAIVWRPIWSGEQQTAEDGSEFRYSYWNEPLYEFDLVYNVLRAGARYGVAFDEFQKVIGLFNACRGATFGFKYKHPDDHKVTRQLIGTTNETATFDLVRTYGANNPSLGLNSTEHIGMLDQSQPFNLYIDDSLTPVSSTSGAYAYTLSLARPVLQQLVFGSAPAAGHRMYVDMSYFYYCRFKEQQQEFERFAHQLWAMKKLTLRTLRTEVVS